MCVWVCTFSFIFDDPFHTFALTHLLEFSAVSDDCREPIPTNSWGRTVISTYSWGREEGGGGGGGGTGIPLDYYGGIPLFPHIPLVSGQIK